MFKRIHSFIFLFYVAIGATMLLAADLNNPCKPGPNPDPNCFKPDGNCGWECKAPDDHVCCVTIDSSGLPQCKIVYKDDCCNCGSGGVCPIGKGTSGGGGGPLGGGPFDGNHPLASSGGGGGGGGGEGSPYGFGNEGLGAAKGYAQFFINLGHDNEGRGVGKLQIGMNGLGDTTALSPVNLKILLRSTSDYSTQFGEYGLERLEVPQADIDVNILTNSSYEIVMHRPDTTNNIVTWKIEDPEAFSNNVRKVVISEIIDGATNDKFSYDWTATNLVITRGNDLTEEHISWSTVEVATNVYDRTDIHIMKYPGGDTAQRIKKTYRTFRFGGQLTKEERGAAGSEEVFYEADYYNDENSPGSYGKKEWEEHYDGSWTRYEYDEEGRVTLEETPFGNAERGSTGTFKTVTYSYEVIDANEVPFKGDARWRTKTTQIGGTTIQRTYRAFYHDASTGDKVKVEEIAYNASAGYGDENNLRTESREYGDSAAAYKQGRPRSIEHPDGSLDVYSYDLGTYTTNQGAIGTFASNPGGDFIQVEETLDSEDILSYKSLQRVKVLNNIGLEVQEETKVYTGGGYEAIDWTCTSYNEDGQPDNIWYANGLEREMSWDCCGKTEEVFPDGRTETYVNDTLGRMTSKTLEDVPAGDDWPAQVDRITTYVYDAAGNLLSETFSGGALSLMSSNAYDRAGRRTLSRGPDGLETIYSYTNGVETITTPGSRTRVISTQRDGKTQSITGNSVVPKYFTYGVLTNGNTWSKTSYGEEGSAKWNYTEVDMLGHVVQRSHSAFGGATTASSFTYNDAGQVTVQEETGRPDRLYEYDDLGSVILYGYDVNGNGTLDLASMDRIQGSETIYTNLYGLWYRRSISTVYPTDNDSTPVKVSESRVQVGGSGCACSPGSSESEDVFGIITTVDMLSTPTNAAVTMVTSSTSSTGIQATLTVNGLVQWRTLPHGGTIYYFYDDLGRQTQVVDPRTGTNTTSYASDGKIEWVEDAAGNRTMYGYDTTNTGERISVTDPMSNTTYTMYNPLGLVTAQWGAVYPVYYKYDGQGRMTNMLTWASGSPATTVWQYDDASGLLTAKVDAAGEPVSYSYSENGELITRTWARGDETTYVYDDQGNLVSIDYDDATPDVSNTYDRIGRKVTVSDALGVRTNVYDANTLVLTHEYLPDGTVIQRAKDSYGREQSFSIPGLAVGYGYDDIGRLDSVTSSVIPNVAYSYLDNSDLLAQITSTLFKVTRSYEPNRNVMTQMLNIVGGAAPSQFSYGYDSVGRRTNRADLMTGITNVFGYNQFSELVSAGMGTNTYAYEYDLLGNRETSTYNSVEESYFANDLNQYTNIAGATTSTPTYDDDGNMLTFDGWYFTWNGENRMIGASNASTAIESTYDYMGRRVKKVVDGSTNTFIYDGWNLVCEIKDSGITNRYVWGLDLSQSRQGAGGVGGLLAASFGGTTVVGYCYDANGNVTDLVDSNESSLAYYEYGPYGGLLSATGPYADDNPFRFSTKYHDDETGLVYYGYRYYLPELGRWVNRDPIGERGGHNLYGFVRNNPYRYVDRLGKDVWFENTPSVYGLHQRVCVDVYDSCCKKTGKYCVSFGLATGAGGGSCGSGVSEDGGFSDPDSGSSSEEGGAITPGGAPFPDDIDPDMGGDGQVYEDNLDPATEEQERTALGCQESQDVQRYLKGLVGNRANYSILGQSCRDFSQAVYDEVQDGTTPSF